MVKDVENGFAGSCFESWRTDPGATTVAAAEQEEHDQAFEWNRMQQRSCTLWGPILWS
jgi:hypothetical protein